MPGVGWSIQQVARMSGVTARTLRYYDEIGLLRPARIGANGHRFYEYEQLLRLQHILLLRELGMNLSSIASVVDGVSDRLETLRAHLDQLRGQRDRLDALIRTVSSTIAHLEKGLPMPADEIFDGFHFDRDTIDELEALAADRPGQATEPYFDELRNRTADWTPEQFRAAEQAGAETERRLLALLEAGVPPDDPAVFAVLDDDLAAQNELLPLSAEEYGKLGQAFVTAPELRAHLDARNPQLAEYMRDAMVAYASTHMT
jgi:DNA-binding transcriptional MerR regulator